MTTQFVHVSKLDRIRALINHPELINHPDFWADAWSGTMCRLLRRDIREILDEADLCHDEYGDAAARIFNEATTARMKFPPFNSAHEGYAVLLEEIDELWDEVKRHDIDHAAMIDEAVQVGAMAIRFIADLEGKK